MTESIYTLEEFGKRHPSFPPNVTRNLIWKAKDRYTSQGMIKGNGLESAIIRIGRRVYLKETRFFEWVNSLQAPHV